MDTPAQRVQFLLGTEDGDEEHIPHALFTELDEICLKEGEDAEWKETARYTALVVKHGLGLSCCALWCFCLIIEPMKMYTHKKQLYTHPLLIHIKKRGI